MRKFYICGCSSICHCSLPLGGPKLNTYLPSGYYPLKDKVMAQGGGRGIKSWRLND
jgi:hypothetical protein